MPFHGRATHGSIEIGEANVTIDRGFQHVIAHGSSFRFMARDANRKGHTLQKQVMMTMMLVHDDDDDDDDDDETYVLAKHVYFFQNENKADQSKEPSQVVSTNSPSSFSLLKSNPSLRQLKLLFLEKFLVPGLPIVGWNRFFPIESMIIHVGISCKDSPNLLYASG